VFGRQWRMTQNVAYIQGIESEYTFVSPSWSPALVWEARRGLGFTTDLRFQYFKYLTQDVDLTQVQESRLGLDLTSPYYLSILEEKVVWDRRDDPLFTRRGSYTTASVGIAGLPGTQVPVVGDFNFLKGALDWRLYRSLAPLFHLHEGMVLATRIAAGAAIPYGGGDSASVPYAERVKLGGGTTVSGWVTDHLGPWLCRDASTSPVTYTAMSDQACADVVPIGGELASWGSVELRKSIRWGVGVVGFVDVGMAWDTPADVLHQVPLASAGTGVRYASPVGPVRLDVAFRLDDSPYFQSENWFNIHFSLSEAF